MKGLMVGSVLAIMLASAPAFAGHYSIQVWDFTTDDCDAVATGQVCESVTVEVSTSTWCGSSCSSSEKSDTFSKAITALQSYWNGLLQSAPFRGMVQPSCGSNYFGCHSLYSGGFSNGAVSVENLEDGTSGSRNDYTTEIDRHQIIK